MTEIRLSDNLGIVVRPLSKNGRLPMKYSRVFPYRSLAFAATLVFVVHVDSLASADGPSKAPPQSSAGFEATVKPLLGKYCLDCHSAKTKKGSLDLERFTKVEDVQKDVKPWQEMIEQLAAGEMPPQGKPQPSETRKNNCSLGTRLPRRRGAARSGDPGRVPLRRLSNAEYDATSAT